MGERKLIHSELIAKLSAELSTDQSGKTCAELIHTPTADIAELYNEVQGLDSKKLIEAVSKLEIRNKELESALQIKETAMEKLASINSNLQKEMKIKDTMRLSQMELLAIRNLELEKELSKFRADDGEPPSGL